MKITIISVGNLPGRSYLQVGAEVVLKKEPENLYDKHAVAVYAQDELAGYVGNKPNTIAPGCISATELNQHYFNNVDEIKAVIREVVTVTYSNGKNATAWVAELLEIEEQTPAETNSAKYQFCIKGDVKTFPGKTKPKEFLLRGETPKVELVILNDQVICYFEGEPVGQVDDSNFPSTEILPAERIKELLLAHQDDDNEYEAKLVRQIGTKYQGVLTFKEKSQLERIIQQVIDEGILTEEEVQERLAYLDSAKYPISERNRIALFKQMEKFSPEIEEKIPRPDTLYQDIEGHVATMVANFNIGLNQMLKGPMASGKNTAIETIAWLFRRPLFEIQINSDTDTETLLGSRTFNDGRMGFEESPLITAMKIGGIIVLDEFNTGLPQILSKLNSIMDKRKRINVPGLGLVKAHPMFRIFATQNEDYQGTFDNNEATSSRFTHIVFESPQSIKEILAKEVPEADEKILKVCDKLYQGIKKSVEKGELGGDCLNLRAFKYAVEQTLWDVPLKKALIDNVGNSPKSIDDRKSIINMIDVTVV